MEGRALALLFLTAMFLTTSDAEAQVGGSGTPGTIPVWETSTTLRDSSLVQGVGGSISNVCNGGLAPVCLTAFNNASGDGVQGFAADGTGVYGQSNSGVQGISSISGTGVFGQGISGRGVQGQSHSAGGVVGFSDSSVGVAGNSTSGRGVQGISDTAGGVVGISTSSVGIAGISDSSDALVATTSAQLLCTAMS